MTGSALCQCICVLLHISWTEKKNSGLLHQESSNKNYQGSVHSWMHPAIMYLRPLQGATHLEAASTDSHHPLWTLAARRMLQHEKVEYWSSKQSAMWQYSSGTPYHPRRRPGPETASWHLETDAKEVKSISWKGHGMTFRTSHPHLWCCFLCLPSSQWATADQE